MALFRSRLFIPARLLHGSDGGGDTNLLLCSISFTGNLMAWNLPKGDPGVHTSLQTTFMVPSDYKGNPKLSLIITSNAFSPQGTIYWHEILPGSGGSGTLLIPAFSSPIEVDITSLVTLGTLQPNQLVSSYLVREGGNSLDTFSGTLCIAGMVLDYDSKLLS
jgi:hypothetical protein